MQGTIWITVPIPDALPGRAAVSGTEQFRVRIPQIHSRDHQGSWMLPIDPQASISKGVVRSVRTRNGADLRPGRSARHELPDIAMPAIIRSFPIIVGDV